MKVLQFDLKDKNTRAFIDLPWTITIPDYPWGPPLSQKENIERELSPNNPFFLHAEAAAFMIAKGDQLVARLLATIDRNIVQPKHVKIGHFGYFECIDDENAATQLFIAAQSWFRSHGVTVIHGPINLTIFNGYRLQVDGFRYAPFMGEPRNPEYYPRLLQVCGFSKGPRWRSWDLTHQDMQIVQADTKRKLTAMTSSLDEDTRVENFDLDNLTQEWIDLFPVITETFRQYPDYTLIDENEYRYTYRIDRMFASGRQGKAINRQNQVMGFIFCYDDPGVVQASSNSRNERAEMLPNNGTYPKILMYAMAIKEQYRHTRVAYQLLNYLFNYVVGTGWAAIGCLVTDGRTFYDKIGPATRSYHTYTKPI